MMQSFIDEVLKSSVTPLRDAVSSKKYHAGIEIKQKNA
jgi:hypothetical protein